MFDLGKVDCTFVVEKKNQLNNDLHVSIDSSWKLRPSSGRVELELECADWCNFFPTFLLYVHIAMYYIDQFQNSGCSINIITAEISNPPVIELYRKDALLTNFPSWIRLTFE